jgi:hypothetical protein
MALAPGGRQIAGGLMGRGVRPGRSPETRRAGFSRSQSGKGVCKDAHYHNLYQDSRDICSSGDSSPKVFFLNFFVATSVSGSVNLLKTVRKIHTTWYRSSYKETKKKKTYCTHEPFWAKKLLKTLK